MLMRLTNELRIKKSLLPMSRFFFMLVLLPALTVAQPTVWINRLPSQGLLSGLPLLAQDSMQQHIRLVLVKTNLAGPFSLFIEVPTTPRQSMQFSAQRINFSLFSTTRIFNFTPEYRFYRSKLLPSARRPAPKGLYVGPYLKYRYVADEHIGILSGSKYATVTYSMFGGGAVAGAQFISRGGFVLDAFLGAGYFPLMQYEITTERSTVRPPEAQPQRYRFDLRVGLCIGLAVKRLEDHVNK